MINSEEPNETLVELITSKNVRAITTIGVKLTKDFFKKYKA